MKQMTDDERLDNAIQMHDAEAKLLWLKYDYDKSEELYATEARSHEYHSKWLREYKKVKAIVDRWNNDYHDPAALGVYFEHVLDIFNE